MNSSKNTAKIAGFLYLLVIVFGIFSELYVRSSLIVAGDAATTARNIQASEWLFRIGFVSDIVMLMSYFLLGIILYGLFKPIDKNLALVMLLFNLIGVPIMGINLLNHFAALLLLNGDDYLKIFNVNQLQALAMFFLNLHKYGYIIAAISFGSWLLPLGYLVFKSGYFPGILGILLMIASLGYLIEFLTQFLFPDYVETVALFVFAPEAIAELSFCLWLLVKGARAKPVISLGH